MINRKIKFSIKLIIVSLIVIFISWIITKIMHSFKLYNDIGMFIYSLSYYLVVLSLFVFIIMTFRLLYLLMIRKKKPN